MLKIKHRRILHEDLLKHLSDVARDGRISDVEISGCHIDRIPRDFVVVKYHQSSILERLFRIRKLDKFYGFECESNVVVTNNVFQGETLSLSV